MFNFVRLSEGGAPSPPGELKSEVEVICALAARVLKPGPFPFAAMNDHRAVRDAIAKVVPGYEEIGRIDATRQEFQIEGRTFHAPRFATPSGKARASVPPLPAFRAGEGEFRLMTLRSEGQFNTVVYEEEDLYRGTTRRDVVMMSEADAARVGLREGDAVAVVTSAGRLVVVVSFIDIPAGNLAMYYPGGERDLPAARVSRVGDSRLQVDRGCPSLRCTGLDTKQKLRASSLFPLTR